MILPNGIHQNKPLIWLGVGDFSPIWGPSCFFVWSLATFISHLSTGRVMNGVQKLALWPFLWVYDNISNYFIYSFLKNRTWLENIAGKSPEIAPSEIYKVLINIKQQQTNTTDTHDPLHLVPTPLQFIWKLPKKAVN